MGVESRKDSATGSVGVRRSAMMDSAQIKVPQEMSKAISFVSFDAKSKKFAVNTESISLLRGITGPLAVISVCGYVEKYVSGARSLSLDQWP